MTEVDLLIHARWVIPVEPHEAVYEFYALAVKDGFIVDVLPSTDARTLYQPKTEFDLQDHALIPGLVNAHTHSAMSLMRGIADDLPLMEWLQDHIWPAEAEYVSADFVREGTQLAMAEMLRSGTTCFNDMYFFPGEVAQAALDAGMRACVNLIVIEFPSAWAANAEEYLRKGLEVHDQYRHNSLISTMFGPHAPYTVSDESLQKIAMYADEMDLQIQMHVHETAHEISESENQHGKRPLQRLHDLGLLSPRLLAVHMTQLTAEEINLLADTGTNVTHCPESNLKLASGFCPVNSLHQQQINVALGTDGAASNNDLDMLGEMRSAALLAKAVSNDASAISAPHALRMATLNGARALGLEKTIGSLEVGKAADITAINLGDLETQPVYHPISQIVYAASRDKVTHVWVNGKHLLNQRHLTTLDEQNLSALAAAWRDKMVRYD